MCCKWVVDGMQLHNRHQHSQIHHSFFDKDTKSLASCKTQAKKSARNALEILPDDVGGQEEDANDKVKQMDEKQMIETLVSKSGMYNLEDR